MVFTPVGVAYGKKKGGLSRRAVLRGHVIVKRVVAEFINVIVLPKK